jgi:hypothetical protein
MPAPFPELTSRLGKLRAWVLARRLEAVMDL